MGVFRQFPYSNFHEMNMDEILKILKTMSEEWDATKTEWNSYKEFIDNYFKNLDVSEEVLNALRIFAEDGTLNRIIDPTIAEETSQWLAEHITQPTTPVVDTSLSIAGASADAKVTGTFLRNILFRSLDLFEAGIFEKGSLDATGNDDSWHENSRIRTHGLYSSNNNINIQAKSTNPDAKLLVYYYHADGTFDFKSNWTSNVFIQNGRIFKLVLTLNPSDDTLKTISEILEGFDITIDSYYSDFMNGREFKHGSITGNTESDYMYGFRAISANICYSSNDIMIKPKVANARCLVGYYNADGTNINFTSWSDQGVNIPAFSYYRIMLNVDDGVLRTVKEILNCFDIIDSNVTKYEKIIFSKDFEYAFEKGNISNGANDDYRANSRARSIGICESSHDIALRYNLGAFDVEFFTESGTFDYSSGWKYKDYYIPKNTKFRLLLTPNIESTGTYSIDDCLSCVNIELIDDNSIGLDPNIIWQSRNVDESTFPPYSKYYIQASAHNQYDRVRVNVRISTDGQYFLAHDNTINNEARNMDGSVISTPIDTDSLTLAQLNSYDWGIKYGSKYAGMQVPMLEDALKYASMFNMGISIETSFTPTHAQIDEMFEMLSKYGCIEKAIIITASGWGYDQLSYWRSKSEYLSLYIAGVEEMFTQYETDINSFKTDKSTIYCQLYPWGTQPTDTFRRKCVANGWKLYSSTCMNKTELFNIVGFDHGLSLIEVTNVYNIKNTVREYTDAIVAQ